MARRIENGSNGRASCRTATALDHHIPNFRPNGIFFFFFAILQISLNIFLNNYFFFSIGCFWVYWDHESFEHVREAVERSLLSNLEQDDHSQNNQVCFFE